MPYLALLIILLLGYGAALLMANKSKVQIIHHQGIDNIEDLVQRVAKAVAIEVAKEMLARMPTGANSSSALPSTIQIDESIIPMNIEVHVEESNVEEKIKENKVVDKDLKKAKSKLAALKNKE